MVKWIFPLLFCLNLKAQLDSLDNMAFDVRLNDIWGYVDKAGNEYALVGLEDGFSVVDVSDPSNSNQVFRAKGPNTIWRDIKTYQEYAYVTNEADSGMRIYDLSGLPENTDIPFKNFAGTTGEDFKTAHNIFIDENGRAFVCGTNTIKGFIVYDLTSNPLNPVKIGEYDQKYIHDIYVRNDTAFVSATMQGQLIILDVTNPNAITQISAVETPNRFTHNSWLSDDGKHVFATDELKGSLISSYDISDPSDPELVDTYKSTIAGNELPHNVHVKDSFLFTSYYVEGLVVVDASRPDNLVEVARYDTEKNYFISMMGGAWGVYPYLPSGTILVSDIFNGLFTFSFNQVNAAYLEGVVTDYSTGFPLSNVKIEVLKMEKVDKTSFNGEYKLGRAGSGLIKVVFSKQGYKTDTLEINLIDDVVVQKNVKLEKLQEINVSFQLKSKTGELLEGASVNLSGLNYQKEITTDVKGKVSLILSVGEYNVYSGKWGYLNSCFDIDFSSDSAVVIELDEGYYDDFSANQGWEIFSVNEDPVFERVQPQASYDFNSGTQHDPDVDASFGDCGDWAYITKVDSSLPAAETNVNWTNYLVSPELEWPELKENCMISFNYWLSFSSNAEDSMKVGVIQGADTTYLDYFTIDDFQRQWTTADLEVYAGAEKKNFRVIFSITDDLNPWNIIDAAIDDFSAEFHTWSIGDVNKCYSFSSDVLMLKCGLMEYQVFNIQGQIIEKGFSTSIDLSGYKTGLYLIQIENQKSIKHLVK